MSEVTNPPSIDASPTLPVRNNRSTFVALSEGWRAWQKVAFPQVVAAMEWIRTTALGVFADATAAYNSQVAAQAAAATAQASANAALWNVGTVYAVGQAAVSGINFNAYRRTVAGSGGLDPADPASAGTWVNTGQPPVTMLDVSVDTVLAVGMVYRITASCNVTLPAALARGEWVTTFKVNDAHTVTLLRNGHNTGGEAEDRTLDTKDYWYTWAYINPTVGVALAS